MKKQLSRLLKNGNRIWKQLSKPLRTLRTRLRLQSNLAKDIPASGEQTVLFFSPEALVEPFHRTMTYLARTLQHMGYRVLVTQCFRNFARCPSKDSLQFSFDASDSEEARFCTKCAEQAFHTLDCLGLQGIDLRNSMTDEMTEQIHVALQGVPDDLTDFEFDSVRFGKLCVFDIALRYKLTNFSQVTESQRDAWLQYIETSLTSYLLVKDLIKQQNISHVLHFNSYGINLGAHVAALNSGIAASNISLVNHCNVNLNRVVINRGIARAHHIATLDAWQKYRDLPLPAERVQEIAEDVLFLYKGIGSHIYSPARSVGQFNLHERLKLQKSKKLIVALTSSLDELIAAEMECEATGVSLTNFPEPFESQIEWLLSLMEFAAKRDDLQLVVRIHPREGATKTRKFASEHLIEMQRTFTNLPDNCRIIWPDDSTSTYDLVESADLVLTSWTSMGLEAARTGVPVLAAFNNAVAEVGDDFIERAASVEEYYEKLNELLHRPLTIEQLAHAYRWYNLIRFGVSIELGDVVPSPVYDRRPKFVEPNESRVIEDTIIHKRDVVEINLEKLQAIQTPNSFEQEYDALRQQMRQIIHVICTGEDCDGESTLVWKGTPSDGPSIEVQGKHVVYQVGQQTFDRYSPMVARLAAIAIDESCRQSEAA